MAYLWLFDVLDGCGISKRIRYNLFYWLQVLACPLSLDCKFISGWAAMQCVFLAISKLQAWICFVREACVRCKIFSSHSLEFLVWPLYQNSEEYNNRVMTGGLHLSYNLAGNQRPRCHICIVSSQLHSGFFDFYQWGLCPLAPKFNGGLCQQEQPEMRILHGRGGLWTLLILSCVISKVGWESAGLVLEFVWAQIQATLSVMVFWPVWMI